MMVSDLQKTYLSTIDISVYNELTCLTYLPYYFVPEEIIRAVSKSFFI